MDKVTAHNYFEKIFETRKNSVHPFPEGGDIKFRKHCICCAELASKIASKTAYLNPDKAYVYGLLHDYGRIKDEFNGEGFHGTVGYYAMLAEGYPDIAKICLSHCFYDKDVDIDSKPQPREMLLEAKELVKEMIYDDYDRLLQLVDMINMFGEPCTIEQRTADVAKRYNVSREKLEKSIRQLNQIKAHFDELCGEDVYKIIGIK